MAMKYGLTISYRIVQRHHNLEDLQVGLRKVPKSWYSICVTWIRYRSPA